MPKLIKNGVASTYQWQALPDDMSVASADSQHLIPIARLTEAAEDSLRFGILISGDTSPELLTPAIARAATIAIDFAGFMDGRGFSLARILRGELEFEGELQATGNFMQDQLFYLKRCGFDAFVVADDADIESLLGSLNDFSNSYQASSDEARPLFRRR